jgi:hypothetical protein
LNALVLDFEREKIKLLQKKKKDEREGVLLVNSILKKTGF